MTNNIPNHIIIRSSEKELALTHTWNFEKPIYIKSNIYQMEYTDYQCSKCDLKLYQSLFAALESHSYELEYGISCNEKILESIIE